MEVINKMIDKKYILNTIIDSFLMYKKNDVKESTVSCYMNLIDNHIRPFFGEYEIEQITSDLINNYSYKVLKKEKNLSNKYIREILQLFLMMFRYASKIGIKTNDLQIAFPKVKTKEMKVFSQEDEKVLKQYILNNLNTKNFGILFCLYTGLRIGELCALRWNDIDLDKQIIYINKTIIRIKDVDNIMTNKTKIIVSMPKTDASNRIIPLPSFLIENLKKLKLANNYFFITNTDKYIEPTNYYLYYQNLLKKLNLSHYSFHSIRHTFATKCIENNFDIKSLSEILGHSNVNVTLNRYVHSSISFKRKNMEKLAPSYNNKQ